MSKKVIYGCNLCGKTKNQEELLAYYWVSAKAPQGYELREIGPMSDCDTHICKECVAVVKAYSGVFDK